jgi:hypothetical protein
MNKSRAAVPGPGKYSPDQGKREDYKFSFGAKSKYCGMGKCVTPGPGTYDLRKLN